MTLTTTVVGSYPQRIGSWIARCCSRSACRACARRRSGGSLSFISEGEVAARTQARSGRGGSSENGRSVSQSPLSRLRSVLDATLACGRSNEYHLLNQLFLALESIEPLIKSLSNLQLLGEVLRAEQPVLHDGSPSCCSNTSRPRRPPSMISTRRTWPSTTGDGVTILATGRLLKISPGRIIKVANGSESLLTFGGDLVSPAAIVVPHLKP